MIRMADINDTNRSIDVNEYRSTMIVFYEINNLYNFKRLYMKQLQFAMDNYFLA